MKVITEPTVTLMGQTQFFDHPEHKIPADGSNLVRGLAFAAKGCYQAFGEEGRSCEANQRGVLEHGHGSVLEHAYFTFYVEGVSRNLTLEMNRHRHFGISQQSTRYVAEEDACIVLEPYYAYLYQNNVKELHRDGKKDVERDFIYNHLLVAQKSFQRYGDEVKILMELNPLDLEGFALRKWARGKARNILPGALETKATYTGNIRAWRHFLEMRSSRHAEPEIRRLAMYIMYELNAVAPLYFSDYDKWEAPYTEDRYEFYPKHKDPAFPTFPEFTTEYRKV